MKHLEHVFMLLTAPVFVRVLLRRDMARLPANTTPFSSLAGCTSHPYLWGVEQQFSAAVPIRVTQEGRLGAQSVEQ